MRLTEEDVERVLRIVDELDFREVHIEYAQLKLHVVKGEPGKPIHETHARIAPASRPGKAEAAGTGKSEKPARTERPASACPSGHVTRAPFSGVVYHSPQPGAPPYVTVGDVVEADQTVCLLEVMKLFQSVPAGARGRITQILVEEGSQVEEGQGLFAVEPEAT